MSNKLKLDSSAVQSYLGILQDIITRMANNSSNCKNWCITLVSAILVIIADKNQPNYALIALIPVVLFLFLDAYYLGLEKGFRNSYNHFVHKLKKNTATTTDLFVITPPSCSQLFCNILESLRSPSIYPFYIILGGTIVLARHLIFKS